MYWVKVILIIFITAVSLIADDATNYLNKANVLYESGKKEEAKIYYQKAADKGSIKAHTELAYRYVLSHKKAVKHLSIAAKGGNEKALNLLLDEILFRANNLEHANPEKALEIYNAAKKANPNLELFNEQAYINTCKKCVEAGSFDATSFIEKYKLSEDENFNNIWYYVWQLAEEASTTDGRFGKPDPKLILQLICRGGVVPAEFVYVVNDFYKYWKKDTVVKFEICDYVGSGFGLSFCSRRSLNKYEKIHSEKLDSLANSINSDLNKLLRNSYNSASNFIENKVWNEEPHGGSGYRAWGTNSLIEQKDSFFELVIKIKNGFEPDSVKELKIADKNLNQTYKRVYSGLEKEPITVGRVPITSERLKKVQLSWLKHRDNTSKLFAKLSKNNNLNFWKSWLTQKRVDDLKNLLIYTQDE